MYRGMVDYLVAVLYQKHFSPSEMTEIAELAKIKYESVQKFRKSRYYKYHKSLEKGELSHGNPTNRQ